jgi:hypothetical protein
MLPLGSIIMSKQDEFEIHEVGSEAPATITKAPSSYASLYACYRSGQISERQWQTHLAEDELFRKWVERESKR